MFTDRGAKNDQSLGISFALNFVISGLKADPTLILSKISL